MHLLCNEFKTFSSIIGAIAIHKFQEKGFNNNNNKKLAKKGLQSEDRSGIQIQIQTYRLLTRKPLGMLPFEVLCPFFLQISPIKTWSFKKENILCGWAWKINARW